MDYDSWMGDGRLIVEIKNNHPVELLDLTRALTAFAKEYEEYASVEWEGEIPPESKLFVHEIRSGSIITELMPIAVGVLPFMTDTNAILGFALHIKRVAEWLLTPSPANTVDVPTHTLENFNAILEPIAKDHSNQLNITCKMENHGPVYLNLDSRQANAAQNEIKRQLGLQATPIVGEHTKVLMYWYQARNDMHSNAGDRAIIESISPKAVKVTFLSDQTKYEMLRSEENLFKYAFVVDVQVETVNGRAALYRVLRCHERLEKPT